MAEPCTLARLCPGQRAVVRSLDMENPMRRRLLDLGLTEHTEILCLGRSPMGDPCAYLIRGAVIAIRLADSRQIIIDTEQEDYI